MYLSLFVVNIECRLVHGYRFNQITSIFVAILIESVLSPEFDAIEPDLVRYGYTDLDPTQQTAILDKNDGFYIEHSGYNLNFGGDMANGDTLSF